MIKESRLEALLAQQKARTEVLQEAQTAVETARLQDEDMEQKFRTSSGLAELDASTLPEEKMYSIQSIKQVAIEQRLRFLPIRYFKQDIPRFAFNRVKALKLNQEQVEDSLYILAPSKLFALEDCNDDPLLFAQANDGRYYLIASWGGDLAAWRKWLSIPLRNINYAIASIVVLGALVGLSIPSELLFDTTDSSTIVPIKLLSAVYGILTVAAVFSFLFFSRSSGFSNRNWNSKNFNF